MAQSRKRHDEGHGEEGPSSERWLLTYSDMITLLMVLFIVLFALGQTDIRKFNAFKDSFHFLSSTQTQTPPGGPGVLSQPSAIALTETNPFARLNMASANSLAGASQLTKTANGQQGTSSGTSSGGSSAATKEHNALLNAAAQIQAALNKAGLANDVRFTMNHQGLVVSIMTDKILFPVDSAQLQPAGLAILNAVAPVLASLPNQVDVEGNTDNQPIIGGPYKDNWALSAARAVSVVEYLIAHSVNPARLQATGNSDTRPLVPNSTPADRAVNRRVAIVVFSTTASTSTIAP
jgi:chemotaxis protein MotB